jgi:hypothetical protein
LYGEPNAKSREARLIAVIGSTPRNCSY